LRPKKESPDAYWMEGWVIARRGLGALELKFLSGLGLRMKFREYFILFIICTLISLYQETPKKVLIYYEITTLLTLYVTDPEEVDTVILQNW
jgi:hypothetical protein